MERILPRLRMPLARLLCTTLCCILLAMTARAQDAFITTWKTSTADESITIPIKPDLAGYNYSVDWGDGSTSTSQTGNATHNYAAAGIYTVTISGDFPAIQFGSAASADVNDQKLITVEQWGDQVWQSMHQAF
ncbi:PKD domain-containing protein, partial [Parapedobacter pyrenivorans]|uniref:PKD domain-containing protein n=1 Tax=Parapedobacter pyrenivorans TaxID=1305674 RepID=UPI00333E8BDA